MKRNGAEPTAVRVLPADGIRPLGDPAPLEPNKPKRRWPVPLVVVGAVLLVFLALTRPVAGPDNEAVPTTTPPRLAAVEAGSIDLTQPLESGTTKSWEVAPFRWPGHIADIFVFRNSMVAIGSTPEGAQAWLSTIGAGWRTVPRLEQATSARSSLDHAVVWQGEIVALGSVDSGVGLWTAMSMSNWSYRGEIETMDTSGVMGLVAGKELLAVSRQDGRLRGWTSRDGLEWTATGAFQGLGATRALTVAANEDWYFVGGEENCGSELCRPVIYRSQDAINWEPTSGTNPRLPSGPHPTVPPGPGSPRTSRYCSQRR